MKLTNPKSWSMNTVIALCFACLACTLASTPVQAQTYYYYPTSVPASPTVANVSNVPPTYYVQGSVGNQVVWYTYTPQYYQTVYTPQFYQTTYQPQYYQPAYQPQTVQASSNPQDSQTNSSANNTPPATTTEPKAKEPADGSAEAKEAAAQNEAAVAAASDPYGFVSWLNATRTSYGLSAVGHDPNLTNWAAMNNNQQAARGMGHFVMGPARRQNSAMGAFANIGSMWMNSPAHRAALLDPTIRWIGIAGLGAYWTFNAN